MPQWIIIATKPNFTCLTFPWCRLGHVKGFRWEIIYGWHASSSTVCVKTLASSPALTPSPWKATGMELEPTVTTALRPCARMEASSKNLKIYCIRHIFRGGFIFVNFASLVLFANLSTRENIYLRSRRLNATCVRNTLLSSITNLTTRENVKVPIREIYGVYSTSSW